MQAQKFHLAWFAHFAVDEWLDPFAAAGGNPWDGKFYLEMARTLERACFDYIMFEDTLMVSDVYTAARPSLTLKDALQVPKHDPMPLAAMIGSQTSKLGVVATMSTLAYPPFMLARLRHDSTISPAAASAGTSSPAARTLAAQNFGMEAMPRTTCAMRWPTNMSIWSTRLFDVVGTRTPSSWTAKRKPMPISARSASDPFRGQFFKCRGPLNTVPLAAGPAGLTSRPAARRAAGISPRKHADSIIAPPTA
jgi:hypothetical protein